MLAYEIMLDLTKNHISCSIKDTQGDAEETRIENGSDNLKSLLMCIEEGARKWGCSVQDLLRKTNSVTLRAPDMITDILTNKNGARIGLIVTKGHEKKAYFEGHGENPITHSILAGEMIVAIEEKVSDKGEVLLKPSEIEVKDRVRYLLEFGSGIIVVSFKNAVLNPVNERMVKEMIEFDYPRHYLGAVPVLVASDFSSERDDFIRTTVCLLNAYTWFNLDHFLRGVEALLQKNGYNHSLLVTQADGHSHDIHNITPLKTSASDQIAFARSMVHG